MGFQQLTSPVMVKGVEDTAFYQYNRLVSLNEVGSEPERFGSSVEEFHDANEERGRLGRTRCWPQQPTIPSAARTSGPGINVLSISPQRRSAVGRWRRLNAGKKSRVTGRRHPAGTMSTRWTKTHWSAHGPSRAIGGRGVHRADGRIHAESVQGGQARTSWIHPDAPIPRPSRAS